MFSIDKNNKMSKRTLTKMSDFRERVIENAVNSAREFGYPLVNKENILTDEVYKLYFASILKQTIREVANSSIKNELKKILSEIEDEMG